MARKRVGVNVVILEDADNANLAQVFAAHERSQGMIRLKVRFDDAEGTPVEQVILFSVSEVSPYPETSDMKGVLSISGGIFTFENPPYKLGIGRGHYHPGMKTGSLVAEFHDD